MRPLLLGLIACAACASPGSRPSRPGGALEIPAIDYDVTLRVDPEAQLVSTRAVLTDVRYGVTLQFSERYAFALVEPRFVAEPAARSLGADDVRVERVDAHRWCIVDAQTDPDADPSGWPILDPVEVTWSIRMDHREDEAVVASSDQYEHSYLADDHGMIATAAVLPALQAHQIYDTSVRFDVPDGWDLIVPWREVEPGVYGPDAAAMRGDLVALGDWTRIDGEADGLEYTIAFAPGQERLAAIVGERLPPIVEAEIELFGGAPQPKYVFLFGRPDTRGGYGGSPKANAMTLFVSPDLPLDFVREGIAHLVAHEYHHTWMRAECEPEDELRFVAEGFTDYYAYVVPWRLGTATDDELARTLADKVAEADGALARYGGSVARAGGPDFFAGRDAYSVCYAGGLSLALWTDLALRAEGDDLDELMRRFYGDPRWSSDRRPSLDDWAERLRADLGDELADAHVSAVRDPEGIDWPALFALVDVELERAVTTAERSPRANFDGTTVTAIDPSGSGALIGLRSGDRLLRVNGADVDDEAGIRRAWSAPARGRISVTLERDGGTVEIDVPEPKATTYRLPGDLVGRLTPRSSP